MYIYKMWKTLILAKSRSTDFSKSYNYLKFEIIEKPIKHR